MLDKLKKATGGDTKQMKLRIHAYIDGMSGRVNSLKNALEQENYQGIGNIVMRAKPHFEVMGFDDLYRLANHVERSVNKIYSKDMVKEHTQDFINDLEASIEKVKKAKI